MMDEIDIFRRLSVALAIGVLVGLERGWQQRDMADGGSTGGLRTFALGGLLGGLSGLLAAVPASGGGIVLAGMFAIYSSIFAAFRLRELEAEGRYGVTTVVAAMLVFALGAYAAVGDIKVAGAGGAATAGLLAIKNNLHGWLRRISWPELRSVLALVAMTFILLPFLPNRTVDPLGLFNPFEIWLLTVLIAAISFVGYIAIRLAGETYGVAIAGLAGGLASSTAVTVNMSNLAREHPEQSSHLAAGALLAGGVMFLRVLGIVAVANYPLAKILALPLGAACAALVAGAVILLWQGRAAGAEQRELELGNPFEIRAVLLFALVLAVISAGTVLAETYLGDAGVYVIAAVAGLGDVDAITLSMSRQLGASSGLLAATLAISIACATNTIAKAVMAYAIGGGAMGRRVAGVSAMALAAGGLGAWGARVLVAGV